MKRGLPVGDGTLDGKDVTTATSYLDLNLGAGLALSGGAGLRGDIIYTLAGKREFQNLGVLIRFGYMTR
jgi:hypothetical protein